MALKTITELGLVEPKQNETIEVSAVGWNQLNNEILNIANNRKNFTGRVEPSRFYFMKNNSPIYFTSASTSFIPKPYVSFNKEAEVQPNDLIKADNFNALYVKTYFLNTDDIKEATTTYYDKNDKKRTYTYNFLKTFYDNDWSQRVVVQKWTDEDETEHKITVDSPKDAYTKACQNYYNNLEKQKVKPNDLITAQVFNDIYTNYMNTNFCFDITKVVLTRVEYGTLSKTTYTGTIENLENYNVNDSSQVWEVKNININTETFSPI